jgi:hypothetical protein
MAQALARTTARRIDEAVLAYANDMPRGADLRMAHLLNVACATLKHLMLHSESDMVRLKAAQAVVDLPPIVHKMQYMSKNVGKAHERRNASETLTVETVLEALDDAKSLKTKEIP